MFIGDIYERALKTFGVENQMIKCVEELSELQKELCKHSLGQGNVEHIIEEIADVEIMIDQMKKGLGISFYSVDKVKKEKLNRLNERLDREEDKRSKYYNMLDL